MAGDEDRAARVQRELFLRVLTPTKPPPQVARQLAQAMREVRFGKGEVIYQKGTEALCAYFIAQGEVALEEEGEEPWTFSIGAVVGVIDVNVGRPRARTARALTDVLLMEMPRDDWLDVIEDNLDYAAASRKFISAGFHDLVVTLTPDGGFPEPTLPTDGGAAARMMEGTVIERLVAMRGSRLFETASVQALVGLASRGETMRSEKGDMVFAPGAAGRRIVVVLAGTLNVERRVLPVVRASFGPGDVVLGGAAFSGALAGYTVTARTDALSLLLTEEAIEDVSEDHFDLVRSILRGMSMERERTMGVRGRRAKVENRPSLLPPSVRAI